MRLAIGSEYRCRRPSGTELSAARTDLAFSGIGSALPELDVCRYLGATGGVQTVQPADQCQGQSLFVFGPVIRGEDYRICSFGVLEFDRVEADRELTLWPTSVRRDSRPVGTLRGHQSKRRLPAATEWIRRTPAAPPVV